jgi:flagellar biosynthesis GTPase FlhF
MKWIEALKQYNAGKSWCVPRKGTPEYDEVKKIMNRTKPEEVEKRNVERREKSLEQLKALDTRKKIEEERKKRPSEYVLRKRQLEKEYNDMTPFSLRDTKKQRDEKTKKAREMLYERAMKFGFKLPTLRKMELDNLIGTIVIYEMT